jgi:hypothetical protein
MGAASMPALPSAIVAENIESFPDVAAAMGQ